MHRFDNVSKHWCSKVNPWDNDCRSSPNEVSFVAACWFLFSSSFEITKQTLLSCSSFTWYFLEAWVHIVLEKTNFAFKTWFVYKLKYPEFLFMLGIREVVKCHKTAVNMQLAHQPFPVPGLLLRCLWTAASGVDSCASGRIGVFPKISSLAFHLISFL